MRKIEDVYDLLVIGGGINGTAIARDASLRKLKVLLLEQGDYASGASSKTSKLAHGGLRYLEQGALGLIKKSLKERDLLLKNAPHLVTPLPFTFPAYKNSGKPLWMLNLGLHLYDLLDLSSPMPSHKKLSQEEIQQRLPFLKKENLRGGVLYYDALMQDHRIVIENMLSAERQGAHLLNYTKVTALIKREGKISGVRYAGSHHNLQGEAHAKAVVSACGAWSNALLTMDDSAAASIVRPSKGVHLVIPKLGDTTAVVFPIPQDKRIVFLIPWGENMLLGTTDTDYRGDPDTVAVEDDDIQYLLAALNPRLTSHQLTKTDVIASFAGLRPLCVSQKSKSQNVSREHLIKTTDSGMVHTTGGKYTTARKVAEEVVDLITDHSPCTTHHTPLYGGEEHALSYAKEEEIQSVAKDHNISPQQLQHLLTTYGSAYPKILELIDTVDHGNQCLTPHLPHTCAEVAYALTVEHAITLEDWLFRRTSIGYSKYCDLPCIKNVAHQFAEILGWDKETLQETVNAYVRYHL